MSDKPAAEKDAAGAFTRPTIGRTNDGVSSAKPTVNTGSEDATEHREPPPREKSAKDFDLNFKERDASAGDPNKA